MEKSIQSRRQEQSKFLLAAIVDSSSDPIISKDLDGIITSWNAAANRLFGYEEEEIVGRSILTIVPQELHEQEGEILASLQSGGRLEHFETVRLNKHGERIQMSLTISPIKDDTGMIVGASTIAREISEHRRLEEARYRLAAIVESSDDAIISKDLNGTITTWNAAAVRLLEYRPEEIVGQSILKLVPSELHHQEPMILGKIRAGEELAHFETERITKSGKRVEVSLTISPIRDEKGRIIGASKIMRDISQRKALERSLIQAEKLAVTGRMAATMAHEINNPLEAVINLIYLARSSRSMNNKVREHLQMAEKEIERVSHIARQTLGYYRDTTAAKAICVHDIVESVLAVYNSKLRSYGIQVETTYKEIEAISLRTGDLTQVVANLVKNAIDAMPTGGTLRVSVSESGNLDNRGVLIVIQDNGVGIEQEHLSKLFNPFFTTKKNLGTGLGLWLVKQFTEQTSGTVDVKSSTDSQNRGTKVSIFLPYKNALDVEPEKEIPLTGRSIE